MLKLTIEVDEHPENPLDNTDWKLYSFSHSHGNSKHPDEFIQSRDRYGDIHWSIGYKRKAQYSLAHVLSCYQHSGISWSFKGEGSQCRFDTAQIAGVLVWEGKAADCGATPEDREKYARAMLESYNEWANGSVYGFTLVDEENDIDESCWGFYGDGQELAAVMLEHIGDALEGKAFKLEAEGYIVTEDDFHKAMLKRKEAKAKDA